ncbi:MULTISPECIES: M16 family metallopeptidase [Cyanophyceae]|uniref:M16 family metallopeptidase n=1 Tax=Cyanophyceae TaxID=3028117 RepID=UPI0016848157|nr:pitrilysin family protein [Trichocoleus sp. FACHB-40]MBD2003684.1 insulinase family protein [Trichocoleus sp. FACHB-40]
MLQLLKTSQFPADVVTLDNGLTVIHQHLPATPVVVVDVWVKAGATREPQEWLGMAHFLEHMIFKGTERLPPGVFDHVIESRGGMTNAATSHDYAHFFITTAAQYLEDTLPALAEILLNAAIPELEFERERDVVLEEIRQTYDNPDFLGFQALTESIYQRHPYGRPVLGTEEILMERSPDEMRCFHRSHYQPENMTVVIIGGVAKEPALELINRSFQHFSSPLACPLNLAEAEPPIIDIRRQEFYLPRLEQARLMMAWTGPGVDQLQSACGLDLLAVLLSEGRTSRLVRNLREEQQLVQHISSGFSLQQDSSLFTISAYLEPENLDRVEALIGDAISELQNTPVSEAELARCKRLLCNDYAFSTETPSQLAGLYGYYNTIAAAELAVTYPEKIQSFESCQLQQLAQQYLSPYRYAVTSLKAC